MTSLESLLYSLYTFTQNSISSKKQWKERNNTKIRELEGQKLIQTNENKREGLNSKIQHLRDLNDRLDKEIGKLSFMLTDIGFLRSQSEKTHNDIKNTIKAIRKITKDCDISSIIIRNNEEKSTGATLTIRTVLQQIEKEMLSKSEKKNNVTLEDMKSAYKATSAAQKRGLLNKLRQPDKSARRQEGEINR